MANSELTHQDRLLRNAFISEASADHPGDFPAAIRDGVARFRAHRKRLSRAVTETSATPPPKLGKRARRIARAVSEAMTASMAPMPPPAAAPPPAAKPPAASAPLHEMDQDQFAAATTQQLAAGHKSPFWQPKESAPAAPVTESAEPQSRLDVPLHTLPSDDLQAHAAAVLGEYGRARGFASPGWRNRA